MTETTERFLQEIAARVGYDRVAELYLFPVLRQGGVEGAVAVVAAYPEPVEAAEPEAGQAESAEPESGEPDAAEIQAATSEPVSEGGSESDEVVAADRDADADADASAEAAAGEVAADEAFAEGAIVGEAESPAQRPERARHVVYTARYRHTIKGTDRGRWLVEVVAEADAPLITVEEVVRGVVRRSGDAFQPERISGDQFRAIVPAPAVPGSAPA